MKKILLLSSADDVMSTDIILAGDKQNIYAVINKSYCYIKLVNYNYYWYFISTDHIASNVYGNTVKQLVENSLTKDIATSVQYLTDKEIQLINS